MVLIQILYIYRKRYSEQNMLEKIESNEILEKLPAHLKQYIKPQNYDDYTPINQAVWRYVMRKNVAYLSRVAHESYTKGLKQNL